MNNQINDQEIEAFIRESMGANYERLNLESGHALTAYGKETALQQALLYWRKLKDIATRITDTEVRLNLPGQTSPDGRKYGIEGVVDIVRADDKTIMYDIKTHLVDDVRSNVQGYEDQLNIYAHIWQRLRGCRLDETSIIATAFPESVDAALKSGDPAYLAYELDRWDPVVKIEVDPSHVDHIIAEFGSVVDQIENGEFNPAPLSLLQSRKESESRVFASRVCRRCDARFSCDSYRAYAEIAGGRPEEALRRYLSVVETDLEQQDWLTSNLADFFAPDAISDY